MRFAASWERVGGGVAFETMTLEGLTASFKGEEEIKAPRHCRG